MSENKKRYYIAYGSNLNIQQMQWRCPNARLCGTSIIEDYRLLFKGSLTGSYLTIEPMAGRYVPVGIWQVTPDDELALDRYEGYPHFYYKKEMELPITGIKSGRKRLRTAFVYIMHEERRLGHPSFEYYRTCVDGYGAFGFDLRVLATALLESGEENS